MTTDSESHTAPKTQTSGVTGFSTIVVKEVMKVVLRDAEMVRPTVGTGCRKKAESTGGAHLNFSEEKEIGLSTDYLGARSGIRSGTRSGIKPGKELLA